MTKCRRCARLGPAGWCRGRVQNGHASVPRVCSRRDSAAPCRGQAGFWLRESQKWSRTPIVREGDGPTTHLHPGSRGAAGPASLSVLARAGAGGRDLEAGGKRRPAGQKSSGMLRKGGNSALSDRCFSPASATPRSGQVKPGYFLEIAPRNSRKAGFRPSRGELLYSGPRGPSAPSNLNG